MRTFGPAGSCIAQEGTMALPAGPRVFLDETEEQPGDAELIARYIRPHPDGLGRAYAYLADGPPVAGVVRALREYGGDIGKTAASWGVSEEGVRAVLAFYRRHRPYFEALILLEDDDWTDRDLA